MSNKTKPKWSRDLPTETGLYRVQSKQGRTFWGYYVKGQQGVRLFGEIVQITTKYITRWYGPYAEPVPPTESE